LHARIISGIKVQITWEQEIIPQVPQGQKTIAWDASPGKKEIIQNVPQGQKTKAPDVSPGKKDDYFLRVPSGTTERSQPQI